MIKNCEECGNPFEPNKFWQKYCDSECNQMAYLRRKIAKKRTDPLDVLLSPSGPSEVQEAEWKRRAGASVVEVDRQEKEDMAKRRAEAAALVRIVEERTPQSNPLDKYLNDPDATFDEK